MELETKGRELLFNRAQRGPKQDMSWSTVPAQELCSCLQHQFTAQLVSTLLRLYLFNTNSTQPLQSRAGRLN